MDVKTVCFYCARKVWQIFAIGLVLFATLVSLIKYTLPYANDYRQDIERLVSEQFDVNLSIGRISASWQGSGPALVLENIAFKDNQNSPVSVEVAETRLHLNLWQSLKERQLRSNYFVLDGFQAQVDVERMLDSAASDGGGNQQQEMLEGLFLGENGHFAVENSSLTLITSDRKTHRILLDELVWQNRNGKHQAQGAVSLPGLAQNSLAARLSLNGNRLHQVFGDLYLESTNLELASWLNQVISPKAGEVRSDINLQSWLHIAQGRVRDIQLEVLPSHLYWQQGQRRLDILAGAVRVHPQGKGWRMRTSGLKLQDHEKTWPDLVFDALLSAEKQEVWFGGVELAMFRELNALADIEPLTTLDRVKPTGHIEHGYFSWQNADAWRLWLEADRIGWQNAGDIPGASDLSLTLNLDAEHGKVRINGENNHFLTGAMFTEPLAYQEVTADFNLYREASGWRMVSDNLWLSNPDLAFSAEMDLLLSDEPEISLYGELMGGEAKIAGKYFPQTLMSRNLIDYLNGAIKQGSLSSTQLLLAGKLADFPYANGQGQFEVKSRVQDTRFAFAPDWPELQQGDLTLHFNNQRMDIYSHEGKLVNLTLGDSVHVSIDDVMVADELKVAIDKRTDGRLLAPFFAATPLATPLGEVFNILQTQGEVEGLVLLRIGLSDLVVDASGSARFADIPLYLSKPGVPLEKVSGEVSFHNDEVTLSGGKGEWLGMPVSFAFNGAGDKGDYRADIDLDIRLDTSLLDSHLDGLLGDYLNGGGQVKVALGLSFTDQGFDYQADIKSDAKGLISLLPAPYNKRADESWPLTGSVRGDDISNLITLNVNNNLFFNAILDNQSSRISNARLVLGDHDLGLNSQGLTVDVNLAKADMSLWAPVIHHLIGAFSGPVKEPGLFPPLDAINGEVTEVSLAELNFNDLAFKLAPQADGVALKLSARELRANVDIPGVGSARPILINADYLRLNLAQGDTQGAESVQTAEADTEWLKAIPALEFYGKDCRINNYQLDKVTLKLAGTGDALAINELEVDKGDHLLRGKGQWLNGTTTIGGEFKSKDIGELFDEYDITSSVKDSSANIEYSLSWQDTPYRFQLASLGGELKWRLGEGHLTEISDQGARVFSLLSLDSLVRKLKLDFRDVFSKGFFYNQMKGTMQLDKGVAYTRDTKMDGVPADLSIQGYADLNTQEINYDLAVAPQVTSSIPVIVAWMVNPVSGLAALALDKVIHSARVISEIKFKVTGTMTEPHVVELDRKSREVVLPQAAQNQPPEPESEIQQQPEPL